MRDITKSIRRSALRHVAIQTIIVFFISLLTLLVVNVPTALSILLGGLTCIIPNFFFARTFCRQTGAQNAKNIMLDIYKAEILKLLLTGFIFWLIFTLIPVTIMPIFLGFIGAQAAFWVSGSILRF